jgi:hypothetical protein
MAVYNRRQLDLASNDDTKVYLGQRATEHASFDADLPASMEFALEWSQWESEREM